jgi:CBS domain-containing protein
MARKQNESRIADLPTQTIPAVPDHLSMAAARKIAALKEVGVLFVEHAGRLVGVLDDRAVVEEADDATVAEAMAPIGLCLHPAMSITCAHDLFALSGVSMLPVAVGAFLLGAVSRAEVVRALASDRAAARKRGGGTRAAAA